MIRRPVHLAAVLLLFGSQANARPCADGDCPSQPRRRGTHFIAEIAGGLSTRGEQGFALRSLLGVGGKPRSLPIRAYVISEFSFAQHSLDSNSSLPRLLSRQRDLGIGTRLYLPIGGTLLRLFADAIGGASYQTLTLENSALSFDEGQWTGFFALAGGAAARLHYRLSLTLRFRAVLAEETLTAADNKKRLSLTAGLTWHF
ncbi:MAG: hypothetical protein H6707_08465 [Deltaproteobacteria bacterium]|nr:hypothetical protein [Deltaproteobacteria bacterium]